MRGTKLMIGAAMSLLTAGSAGPALAVTNAAQDENDAIVLYSDGLDAMLPSEKDEGLRRALRYLGPRLEELPREIPQAGVPGHVIRLAADALMGPMWMRLGIMEDADPQQGPPFYLSLAMQGDDPDEAKQRAKTIVELITAMAGPVVPEEAPGEPDVQMIDLQGVPLYVGSRGENGRVVTIAALNEYRTEAPVPDMEGFPEGVSPAFFMKFNAGPLQPFMQMALQQAGPQAQQMRMQLRSMGLTGENPLTMRAAVGYDRSYSHFLLRYDDYLKNELYAQMVSTEPLSRSDLSLVPVDATVAQVSRVDLGGYVDYMMEIARQSMGAEGDDRDPMAMIEQQFGFHPRDDLLAHLGDTMGFYMADSTGGGGLLSAVGFVRAVDPTALRETFDRIIDMANQMGRQQAMGYVQFKRRAMAGHEIVTLSFPGLPVPIEPSFKLTDEWFFMAASPQALVAALDQAEGGRKSLLENAQFRAGAGERLGDSIQVSFIDSPRLLRDGYGILSLGASALSNAVQSTQNGRDPGLVLPPYAQLLEGARPSVSLVWFDGDDLVSHSRCDRSALVNIGGIAGAMGDLWAPIVAGAIAAGTSGVSQTMVEDEIPEEEIADHDGG